MAQAVMDRSDHRSVPATNPTAKKPRAQPSGLLRTGMRYMPTAMVFTLLAGLGIYGHRDDWKLPKFAALVGAPPVARDDWCDEHAVPESQCVMCHPDLLPIGKDHGWCKEHGIHNCPLHHPDVAQTKTAPIASPADLDRVSRALAMTDRSENNSLCKNYLRRIQFASMEAIQKAGVDVAIVDRQPMVETVTTSGEITYDQTRFASLSSRVPGTVFRVEKNVGDPVRAGEILALIDAADVGKAKTDLIQSISEERLQHAAITRLDSLSSQGIVSGRKSQEAEAAYAQARARVLGAQQTLFNLGLPVEIESLRGLSAEELVRRLSVLGLPASLIQQVGPSEPTGNALPVRAPIDGVVITRQVAAGEVVDAARTLFQVADTRQLWLSLNVPLEEARRVTVGQKVQFRPDGDRREVAGTLAWISTAADAKTRMVAVRAQLPNADGQLRDETFGTGRIVMREEAETIAVPNEAVHWEGCCHVVFIRDKHFFDSKTSPKVFHVRTVRLGTKNQNYTEILAGVLPGEVVATTGSDVLRAEMLKNNLGEGCTCGK
jgi:multidrug efflux pump subunit AcrA (membrane-fusion protein)